jgi:hypothetical protein
MREGSRGRCEMCVGWERGGGDIKVKGGSREDDGCIEGG